MIEFALWAPSEEVCRQSWIDAGILENGPGWVFTRYYLGIFVSSQTDQGWCPVKADGTPVPGWHCNVRVTGAVAEAMTAQLPKTDESGALLPLFDRTWAAQVFQLTPQDADPVSNFPAGYRNAAGVMYCDPASFSSPTNVIA